MYIYNISIKLLINILKGNKIFSGSVNFSNDKEVEILYNPQIKSLYVNSIEINIETLKCNYGSVRYYFKCPHCGKRAYKLYSRNLDVFVCCKCSNAKKTTLNRTKTDCSYYFDLAVKECKKVDKNYKCNDYLRIPFPEKPKYMRYKKYMKHYLKSREYFNKGTELWMSHLRR